MDGLTGTLAMPRPLLEGALRRLSFADLLQSLSLGEPCQVLFLVGDQVKGFIWLAGRRVVRVRTPRRRDEEAFCELFDDGHRGGFRVYPLPSERIPAGENVGELGAMLVRAAVAQDEVRASQRVTVKLPEAFMVDPDKTVPLNARQVVALLEERAKERPGAAIRAEALLGSDAQATAKLPGVNGQAFTVRSAKGGRGPFSGG